MKKDIGPNKKIASGTLSGEKHPMAKLNNELVVKIREMYISGDFSHRDLGRIFKVSSNCIGKVLRGYTWNLTQ